ncbi:MAG: hypothetical protein VXA48_15925, partial [Deltaproteobacteria bacterium]
HVLGSDNATDLAAGTFDGATVKLQHQIGSTWVDLGSDTTLTADGGGQFITPQSSQLAAVTGIDRPQDLHSLKIFFSNSTSKLRGIRLSFDNH